MTAVAEIFWWAAKRGGCSSARGVAPRGSVDGADDRFANPAATGVDDKDQSGDRTVRRRCHRREAGDLRVAVPRAGMRHRT
jgi:hypothetical protein